MVIQQVTDKEIDLIINNREPKGLFYYIDKEVIVACDNRTGDAWTEEFKTVALAKKWLNN